MKKSYKAILFDLDGTLLPMDMEEFTRGYFHYLSQKLEPYGIEKEKLVPGIWGGTKAMVLNDGKEKNDRVFWEKFEELTGVSEDVIGEACLDYYSNEFHKAKKFTGENPYACKAVETAHGKTSFVVLATNPIFPMVGQITRMGWVGLAPEDFDFVSSYETDCYCKPNPSYYISICQRLGVQPEDCLLIGNDEEEDMYAGSLIGMDCYLVTDSKIASRNHPWNGPSGSFPELIDMLEKL